MGLYFWEKCVILWAGIEPRDNYKLFICFDDGSKVLYDAMDDINVSLHLGL